MRTQLVIDISNLKRKDSNMNSMFQLSHHAQSRMETRKISISKVAQAIFYGQIYSASRGLHKAKFWEQNGKFIDKYTVVFSKKNNCVVTVEHNVQRYDKNEDEYTSKHQSRKIHRLRKRAAREAEEYAWYREECENCNLAFTA